MSTALESFPPLSNLLSGNMSSNRLNQAYITVQGVSVLPVVIALMSCFTLHWLFRYLNVLRQVRGLPIIHSAIELFESGARSKMPHIPLLCPREDLTLDDPWKKYEKHRTDLIACTQMTTPYAVYVTSNPAVAHSISAKPSTFLKPTNMFRYQAINIFGLQLVSCQSGAEHKRHKSVVKACFGEHIMEGAWESMATSFQTMLTEEGLEKGGVIPDLRAALIKLTLIVFLKTGFGVQVPWNYSKSSGTEQMSFYESLMTVEDTMIPQLLLPLWLLRNFPLASVRRLGQAQYDFKNHLYRMYQDKRAELKRLAQVESLHGEKIKPPTDILGAVVHSQMDHEAEGKLKGGIDGERATGLTEKEVIGNLWIFLVAGHETTAHTLGFTQAFLTIYPEWQERLYDEITAVSGSELPSYRDINQLPLCLAACYEALRLRDIVMTLPKLAAEDTTIPYTTWDEDGNVTQRTRVVKKGSHVIIDSPAASRNPFYWEKSTEFDPTRFLDKKTNNIFTGFSVGVRQCIGKRFAEVEMVAYIAHLVKTFKMYPIRQDGETDEQLKARMLAGSEELSYSPTHWPVRLERR